MSASTLPQAGKKKKSLWWTLLHKLGTPLTAGLFLVSTVSGVALFFRWAPGSFHSMHEWLSMVLLVPFILHMAKNWRPIVGYAKRKSGLLFFLLCVIAAIPFAMPKADGGRAGNPSFRALAMMRQASLADLAPVFKSSPEQMQTRLQKAGYQVTDTTQSLDDIAAASNAQPNDLLAALMPARGRGSNGGNGGNGENRGAAGSEKPSEHGGDATDRAGQSAEPGERHRAS